MRTVLSFVIVVVLIAAGCQSGSKKEEVSERPTTYPTYPHMKAADLTPERLAELDPNQIIGICAGESIPDGWVVVSWSNSMDCPGWRPGGMNVMNIKRPGPTETVCAGSPIPPNYVVTGRSNSLNCPDWTPGGQNQKIIRRVQ